MLPKATVATLIPERSSARLTCVIKDDQNVAIPGTLLATLTVTVYDLETQAVINSRNDVSVLNLNGGSVDGSGNFAMQFDPADNQILNAAKLIEQHVWLFEWTYQGGTREGRQELLVNVVNLSKVP